MNGADDVGRLWRCSNLYPSLAKLRSGSHPCKLRSRRYDVWVQEGCGTNDSIIYIIQPRTLQFSDRMTQRFGSFLYFANKIRYIPLVQVRSSESDIRLVLGRLPFFHFRMVVIVLSKNFIARYDSLLFEALSTLSHRRHLATYINSP